MSRLTTTATLSTELFLSYCACDMFATRSCDVMWPLYIMLTLWRCVRQLDSVSKKFPPLYYILKFDFLIFQGSVATCLRCGGYCRMGFVANFTCFPVMQKFWKSVQISQIYIEFKGGNFFETQCTFTQFHDMHVAAFMCAEYTHLHMWKVHTMQTVLGSC